jgi:hypothetical protein
MKFLNFEKIGRGLLPPSAVTSIFLLSFPAHPPVASTLLPSSPSHHSTPLSPLRLYSSPPPPLALPFSFFARFFLSVSKDQQIVEKKLKKS